MIKSIFPAYYVVTGIGAIGGIASIGTRSLISKLVDRDEMGKVMSFLSILDTVAPVISTTAFAYIFKYTIDSYPGAVYLLIAGFILVPIWVTMWIDLFKEPPVVDEVDLNRDENANIEQDDGETIFGQMYRKNDHEQENNEKNIDSSKIATMVTTL